MLWLSLDNDLKKQKQTFQKSKNWICMPNVVNDG